MINATVLAPYAPTPSLPRGVCFPIIVPIISNDPNDRLTLTMLQTPDGRLRLRNQLKHASFSHYDVIIIDSKGCVSVMLELILLAASQFA
ncbi:hypothetical protein [Rouxiella sp. WC2420]|uniref:hypothetical protein n=1 Tax=Rouxiella sp. WC2420 TaxID=3234145 RepID=UPI00350EC2B0